MRLEEYIGTLPEGIMSGDDVQLSEKSITDICDLVQLGSEDVFYHLGCGDGLGVRIAAERYNVRRAVGVDIDSERIGTAERSVRSENASFVCCDVADADLRDATVVLFWFADPDITSRMQERFDSLKSGCRIVTIWGPLPGCMPDMVRFPYIINRVPFTAAADLSEQLLSVFGVRCVDFVTAWEHAERYTRALELPDAQNNRFVTIVQSLAIWIGAKNLGVACGDEVPESIRTYMGILRNFYNIEVEHLLE